MQTDYLEEYLDKARFMTDAAADELIVRYFANSTNKQAFADALLQVNLNTDFLKPNLLDKEPLFKNALNLPDFANVKMMKAGAAFFSDHSGMIMNLLGILSLPYCYAAADGAKVLYFSEKIRNNTQKRLTDTANFVWDVMAKNAFEPNGSGFASIFKVRLTHAAARYYINKSDNWDTKWGIPVNQEDMAGTNLSFSLIVVRGLRKMGYKITYKQQQDFTHLWNVIGSLLGLDETLLVNNGEKAILLEKTIRKRHFKKSTEGVALTQSLVDYLSIIETQIGLKPQTSIKIMRFLLDNEVADILGLPKNQLSDNEIRLFKLKNAGTITKDNYLKNYRQFKKLVSDNQLPTHSV